MRKNKILSMWMAALLLLMSIIIMGGAAEADELGDLTGRIFTESGTTEAYGGGDYLLIAFGTKEAGVDAAFGIIWGTKDHPNSIIPFVIQARYIGVAQVYDDDGNFVEENFPLKVYTFYGMKLATMLEFNDENGDGICNFVRDPDAAWWQSKWEHEEIYNKRIDMNTAWNASQVISDTNEAENEKTWEFTLTAEDQEYKKLYPFREWDPAVEGNVLDKMEFTFHLRARLVEVDGVKVPQFNVTITDDLSKMDEAYAWPVLDSERMDDLTYSGKKATYGIKWDHRIEGWDFNSENENKSLLMEFWGILGNFIPATTTHWFKAQFMDHMGEGGKALYTNENGEKENSTGKDPEPVAPKRLRSNRIDFEGNWSKMGRFTWVSDVTVDGVEKQMYAQIQAGIPFVIGGRWGRLYTGFALLGGLSYPGGDVIYHDPGMDGEIIFDISESENITTNPTARGLGLILMVIIIVAIVAVVALSRGKGKKPEGYQATYDRNNPYQNGPGDWSNYYDRKR
jgi:hypothetical protein